MSLIDIDDGAGVKPRGPKLRKSQPNATVGFDAADDEGQSDVNDVIGNLTLPSTEEEEEEREDDGDGGHFHDSDRDDDEEKSDPLQDWAYVTQPTQVDTQPTQVVPNSTPRRSLSMYFSITPHRPPPF